MPDGTIDIFVETSFLSGASGTETKYLEVFLKENDSFGERDSFVDITVPQGETGTRDFDTEITTVSSGTLLDEYLSTATEFELQPVVSGSITCLTDYALAFVPVSGSRDYYVSYEPAFGTASGFKNVYLDSTIGISYSDFTSIPFAYFVSTSGFEDIDREIFYNTGVSNSGTSNKLVDFTTTYSGLFSPGFQNPHVDVTFAGYIFHYNPFDLACGLETSTHYNFETTASAGNVRPVYFDAMVGVSGTQFIGTDLYCGLVDFAYNPIESTVISGGLYWTSYEAAAGSVATPNYEFDVLLYSLKISELYGELSPGFILEEGDYMSATGKIYVEITDDWYNVTTSGTYWIIDGTAVSGTFTPISGGYKMYYDPVDDFESFTGSTEVTVHAENDNGDYLEKSFYLTSGYIVEYSNHSDYDYGANQKVVVWMSAENNASCPLTEGFAYYFETLDLESRGLGAYINGVETGTNSRDLSASISPQTGLLYLYGKTFRVELRAKDFAGNEMEPYIIEFQIEDDPNS